MIELVARGARASIDPGRGGRLSGLRIDGVEVMHQGNAPAGQPAAFYGGSFPMAPFAGFIPEARLRAMGATMANNMHGGASHGLVFDRSWAVESVSEATATLSCDLGQGWLAGGMLHQRFDLTGDALRMQLAFASEALVPASLGFHPWFRRDLGRGPVRVFIDPSHVRGFDADGFVAGFLAKAPEHPWDHFVAGVESAPVLRWPELDLVLEANTRSWIVYEHPSDAVCIEPVTAAPPEVLAGDASAAPGVPLTLELRLRWTTRVNNGEAS